jgi:hypothetical protein
MWCCNDNHSVVIKLQARYGEKRVGDDRRAVLQLVQAFAGTQEAGAVGGERSAARVTPCLASIRKVRRCFDFVHWMKESFWMMAVAALRTRSINAQKPAAFATVLAPQRSKQSKWT